MLEPRALDLFCGAGGASMGLHRAGYDVIGIDIRPQPRYPFRFIQADAMRPPVRLADFDFIWASPVCKRWSPAANYHRPRREYPDQIAAIRELLASAPGLTCIENVPQAPLRCDLALDGTMFPGLKVIRRRHFELNFPAPFRLGFDATGHVRWRGWATVVGNGTSSWHWQRGVRISPALARSAMGIDWMRRQELSEAVPPAYAEFIGRDALRHLELANA